MIRTNSRRRVPRHGREVSWKINGERVLLAGWGTAVLMQFAHPLVAGGVAEHSVFGTSNRAWLNRLNRTVGAMLALTFGTPTEVATTVAHIDGIHGRVTGALHTPSGAYPAGATYAARDPELLLWVFSTLLYALPRAYRLLVGPLTMAEQDRFCIEAHPMGSLLGIPADRLPTGMAEVEDYLATMLSSGPIAVGETARGLAHELFHPPWPRILYPAIPLLRLPMIAVLPPVLRDAYGFRWNRRRAGVARLAGASTRVALPMLPAAVRYWPHARRAAQLLRESAADAECAPTL